MIGSSDEGDASSVITTASVAQCAESDHRSLPSGRVGMHEGKMTGVFDLLIVKGFAVKSRNGRVMAVFSQERWLILRSTHDDLSSPSRDPLFQIQRRVAGGDLLRQSPRNLVYVLSAPSALTVRSHTAPSTMTRVTDGRRADQSAR